MKMTIILVSLIAAQLGIVKYHKDNGEVAYTVAKEKIEIPGKFLGPDSTDRQRKFKEAIKEIRAQLAKVERRLEMIEDYAD